MQKNNILVHHHIFKNAGSTIDSILDSVFGEKLAVKYDKEVSANEKHYLSPIEALAVINKVANCRSFSSHQLHGQQLVSERHRFFDLIMIRHPIARLKSIHSFYCKSPDLHSPMADAARLCDFESFAMQLTDGAFPHAASNFQTLLLSSHMMGPYLQPNREALRKAMNRFAQADCPGIVELFDLSMAHAKAVLSPYFGELDFQYNVVNSTSDESESIEERLASIEQEIGTDTIVKLTEMNDLDITLWEFAREMIETRSASVYGLGS
jgi:hypothetical protein